MNDVRISRRGSLLRLGGLAAGILGIDAWRPAESEGAGPAGVASGAIQCVLAPEQTQGPYYIADELVRRNITEGRPGAPLFLHANVVDASTCKAIRSAAVDIWHADALGAYSGFGAGAASQTFMRGIQRTDVHGRASFRSVYPGWYSGRTVHIHIKVHIRGAVVHTGQLYFPDAVTDAVYRNAPYHQRPGRDTRNADDAIYRNGGKRSLVTVRKRGNVYVASITMGVHRA